MIEINLRTRPGRNHAAAIALLENALAIFRRDAEDSRIRYSHRKHGCRWSRLNGRYVMECRCPQPAHNGGSHVE